MTDSMLAKANLLKQKMKQVSDLIQGMNEHNVLTLGVGFYVPIRYSADIADPRSDIDQLESRCYAHFKTILESYYKELSQSFEQLGADAK